MFLNTIPPPQACLPKVLRTKETWHTGDDGRGTGRRPLRRHQTCTRTTERGKASLLAPRKLNSEDRSARPALWNTDTTRTKALGTRQVCRDPSKSPHVILGAKKAKTKRPEEDGDTSGHVQRLRSSV